MQKTPQAIQPILRHIGFYKAPPVSAVTPVVIPPKTEVIEMVMSGVVYFEEGGKDREVGCGALFWHLPGEKTIYRTDADFPYTCLTVHFTTSADPVRTVPRLSIIADHLRTKELCHEILRAYHNDSIDRAILGSYARHRLLWEAHLGTIQNTAIPRPPALEAALVFLESKFMRPEIGVAELAEAAGLSEPRLHVLFREYLRQTPYHMLTARRIREAKWLLSGTSRNIKTLCEECGFANVETFYRAFKKYVGMPPHRFRACHASKLRNVTE
ncbi:MAG: helix-turn-helix transcriptional regulator [Chthoniobacteraceae bacterium]|nr:helix-turn-helix transcriptional regulator [Chthoniobacteraceae bacterium]